MGSKVLMKNCIKVRYNKSILVKFWLDFELFYFIIAAIMLLMFCGYIYLTTLLQSTFIGFTMIFTRREIRHELPVFMTGVKKDIDTNASKQQEQSSCQYYGRCAFAHKSKIQCFNEIIGLEFKHS